ncbi:hypothetical protein LBMAG03_13130 [Actinomycetes bacterium]|nr:hypothetical protein LBMAG03_13130 [Actinomycetes bacterium]
MQSFQSREEVDTRRLIIESASQQIDRKGIIGLRLADVARGANVSIPLISRYFGSRDGLLAAVLGDWYEGFTRMYRSMVDTWLESSDSLTLEEFAMLSPKPRNPDFKKAREFRLQVLAAAIENPELRNRISEISTESYRWILDVIRRGKHKLPEADRHFDERIFSLLLFNTMYVFTDLVPESALDDAEYSDFLTRLIRASSRDGKN